jgi:hypothetical protein
MLILNTLLTQRDYLYMHGASTRTKVTTTENTMHVTAVLTAGPYFSLFRRITNAGQ